MELPSFTRERNSDLRIRTSRSFKTTNASGAVSIDGPYTVDYVGETKDTLDVPHHDFKRRKKAGEIMVGPFHLNRRRRIMIPSFVEYDQPEYGAGVRTRFEGDLVFGGENEAEYDTPLQYISEQEMRWLEGSALIKAMNKVKSSNLLGGEFLSDLDKTVSLLHRPFGNALELCRKMVKAKRKLTRRGTRGTKAAAQSWLEYQHGLVPLFLDISELIEKGTQDAQFPATRYVARGMESIDRKSTGGKTGMSICTGFSADVVATLHHTVSCHAGVIYQVVNRSTAGDLAKFYGLRGRDLPLTLWEITPHSWVVDYFVGVGDWLQAITPDPDIDIRASWSTMKDNSSRVTSLKEVFLHKPSGARQSVGSAGDSVIEHDIVTRWANPTLPNRPMLQKGLSALHSANLGAVTVSKIISTLHSLKH